MQTCHGCGKSSQMVSGLWLLAVSILAQRNRSDFWDCDAHRGPHPVLPFLVFLEKGKKTHKKTRPKISGKEGEKLNKRNKEFLAGEKTRNSKKARKGRTGQKSLAISETLHCDLGLRWKVARDLRFESPKPFFLRDFWRFGSVNAEIVSDWDCAIVVR